MEKPILPKIPMSEEEFASHMLDDFDENCEYIRILQYHLDGTKHLSRAFNEMWNAFVANDFDDLHFFLAGMPYEFQMELYFCIAAHRLEHDYGWDKEHVEFWRDTLVPLIESGKDDEFILEGIWLIVNRWAGLTGAAVTMNPEWKQLVMLWPTEYDEDGFIEFNWYVIEATEWFQANFGDINVPCPFEFGGD